MKKLIAAILVFTLIFCSGCSNAEEKQMIGDSFYIEASEGYQVEYLGAEEDMDEYMITKGDTFIFTYCFDLGKSGATWDDIKNSYGRKAHKAEERLLNEAMFDCEKETRMKKGDDFYWIGFTTDADDAEYRGAVCIHETSLLKMIFCSGESMKKVKKFMDHLHYVSEKAGTSRAGGDEMVTCYKCKGNGKCSFCEGTGFRIYNSDYGRECTLCKGSGVCSQCAGTGMLTKAQEAASKQYDAQIIAEGNRILFGGGSSGSNNVCSYCNGTGKGTSMCTWCGGSGISPAYESTKGSVLHAFAEKDCPKCGGKGHFCVYCGGTGKG